MSPLNERSTVLGYALRGTEIAILTGSKHLCFRKRFSCKKKEGTLQTMKKKSFGARYLHLATKKPWFFYGILIFGVALFLYLTLTTAIETDMGSQTLFHIIFVRAGNGLGR